MRHDYRDPLAKLEKANRVNAKKFFAGSIGVALAIYAASNALIDTDNKTVNELVQQLNEIRPDARFTASVPQLGTLHNVMKAMQGGGVYQNPFQKQDLVSIIVHAQDIPAGIPYNAQREPGNWQRSYPKIVAGDEDVVQIDRSALQREYEHMSHMVQDRITLPQWEMFRTLGLVAQTVDIDIESDFRNSTAAVASLIQIARMHDKDTALNLIDAAAANLLQNRVQSEPWKALTILYEQMDRHYLQYKMLEPQTIVPLAYQISKLAQSEQYDAVLKNHVLSKQLNTYGLDKDDPSNAVPIIAFNLNHRSKQLLKIEGLEDINSEIDAILKNAVSIGNDSNSHFVTNVDTLDEWMAQNGFENEHFLKRIGQNFKTI